MSGRIFQNVVLQFKETTDRTIGVIDSEGTVIACSELTGIGKKWTKYVEPIAAAEGNCVTMEGKTFKAMPGWGSHFDYAVFTSGDDSVGRTVCSMACVALNAAKVYYDYLLHGDCAAYVDGFYRPDSIPESYREQLIVSAKQYVGQMKTDHQGLVSVEAAGARIDTAKHVGEAYLMLGFGDKTKEEIVVPLVLHNGNWMLR